MALPATPATPSTQDMAAACSAVLVFAGYGTPLLIGALSCLPIYGMVSVLGQTRESP